MRKNTRKLLSLTLALCLALALLPTAALAEETQTSGTYGDATWKFENGTLTISGKGISPNPTASMGYYPGSESYPWWSYCDETTAVVLGDGITYVGPQAFRNFTNLVSVTIPDSVNGIGFAAFAYCSSLTSVKIPEGVTQIGGCQYNAAGLFPGAFAGCSSLTSVTLPNSLTAIGSEAFMGCKSLASISIPSGVTSIGGGAFAGCSSLTSVKIPDGVEAINGQHMYNPSLIIPGTFSGCTGLTSVTIPDSVTEIGSQAFSGCSSLTSVAIPDSVTSIGDYAFSGCSSLTSITLPKGLTEIGAGLLSECSSLKSVTIPGSVAKIGRGAFCNCASLTSVTIPDGVTEIEGASYGLRGSINAATFEGCSGLTSVTIPSSVTSIGNGAFYQCNNLKDVYYCGTEEQWKSVSIVEAEMIATFPYDNYPLLNATIHYNSTGTTTPTTPDQPTVQFSDVKAGDWYYDAVNWAVEKGITKGTSDTTFSPNDNCTHDHILTFLWRAAGEPESTAALPFTPKNDWAAGALAWAYEKGMIGADIDEDAACASADAVNYIWQAKGKTAASYDGRFTDVAQDAPYAQAVAWAVDSGVTNGTSATTFDPAAVCSRARIVTFLQRAFQ